MLAFQILFRAVSREVKHYDPMTTMVLEQIHENWRRHDFNIKSLAGNLHVDRSTLSRRFHKVLGTAPSDYLACLRIQNALALLQHSNRPITEIMSHCGYEDICCFSRLISLATGYSPRQFRVNYREFCAKAGEHQCFAERLHNPLG